MAYPDVTPWPNLEDERRSLRQLLQGSRTRAYCRIIVAGRDVTNKLDPYLISVTVTDKLSETDEAAVELDDRDARLEIPRPKSPITIELGWERESLILVFSGVIMEIEWGFGRKAGGRRMWLDCKGFDTSGPAKDQMQWHKGEGQPPGGGEGEQIPLTQVFPEVAGKVGFSGKVSPGVGNAVKRDYWAVAGESFIHWGHRIATETGMFFKIGNITNATLTDARDDQNASGERLPTVLAEWGVNLITARIKPFVGRPSWAGASTNWFDIAKGLWQKAETNVAGGGPFDFQTAIAGMPMGAPNAQVGEQFSAGMGAYGLTERTHGNVVINGEPSARAKGTVIVWGARPGVDGRYGIFEAEHIYTRGGGYVTRCTLRRGGNWSTDPYWAGAPKPGDVNSAPAPTGGQPAETLPEGDVSVGEVIENPLPQE